MTEEEAKTKWCPFARVATLQGAAVGNMGAFGPDDPRGYAPLGRCIGSECMAWRWTQAKETDAYLSAVQAYMKANNASFNVATGEVWKDHHGSYEKVEGHCGLAGKP